MIVAIDGPAGAGKSTVARAVATRLGFAYLDTGALYRATALRVLREGLTPADAARTLDVALGDRVLLAGEDVTDAIRTPEVADTASTIAADPAVRAALLTHQRTALHRGDWVAEGRDIGTVVAPEAELKVFLTASPQERARRRAAQSGRAQEDELTDLQRRDEQDSTRDHSPLAAAPDAVAVDTDGLTFEQVVDEIARLVHERTRTVAPSPMPPPLDSTSAGPR